MSEHQKHHDMIEFKTPYTFDKVVRLLIGLTIIVLIFLLFKRLSAVLTPFFIGWLIAYLLHPIVKFFQYKLKFKSRILSIITTLLLFFGSITGVIMLLIPQISKEVSKVSVLVQNFTQNFNVDSVLPIAWQNAIVEHFSSIDVVALINNPNIMEVVRKVAPQLWSLLNGSLSFVLGLMVIVIILLYLIFILKDYEKYPTRYRRLFLKVTADLSPAFSMTSKPE